ncbi:MAG: PilZ domain-containing protein [Gammaproteobacteria bacterium]
MNDNRDNRGRIILFARTASSAFLPGKVHQSHCMQHGKAIMEINKQHQRIAREYPRIKVEIHCSVGLPGGNFSAGLIRDLSEGGLKFSCGLQTIHSILPEDLRTPDLVNGVMVKLLFELPRAGLGALAVECDASLVHFERFSHDDFHVGIQFSHLDKVTRKGLRTYLQSALEAQAG